MSEAFDGRKRNATESARRTYFEQLTGLLISNGVAGSDVGPILAELDDHMTMSDVDPVVEFGPVGEFAQALLPHATRRSRSLLIAGHLLLSAATTLAIATTFALISGRDGNGYSLSMSFVVGVLGFVAAITIMQVRQGPKLIGRSRVEWPQAVRSGLVSVPIFAISILIDWSITMSGLAMGSLLTLSLAAIIVGWRNTLANWHQQPT